MFIRLYSGSLVHTVAHKLMKGVEPESLLTGASFAVDLYRNLQAAVERELDHDFLLRMRTRVGQRAEPREHRGQDDLADELSTIFKHLMQDEEEDDIDDKIYEEMCSARTRHVSRAHTEDPRARKCQLVKWC